MQTMPLIVNNYNLYLNGVNRMLGVQAETALPTFSNKTVTNEFAGVLGELETVAIGYYTANELEIKFKVLNKDMFNAALGKQTGSALGNVASWVTSQLIQPGESTIELRAAAQSKIYGANDYSITEPMSFIFKGECKEIALGTLKNADGMDSSIKMTINYAKYYNPFSNEIFFELDKLNNICIINGQNVMASISNVI